ncbi:MAG: c-type cytochrome [Luteitalea sp.]|nr:c-type cytochrome [Luteitalea sp.]
MTHRSPSTRYLIAILLLVLLTGCRGRASSAPGDVGSLLDVTADDIPIVQVLVPGFTVNELPVSLNNINAVRYGPDGRLYALGYDGHIHVLTDTSGDGIEDRAEPWWDKDPLLIPVGMVVAEEGIYVTSHKKVSLLKDTNADGKGDTETVIAEGWRGPSVYSGTTDTGVDAFGIARDEAGSIFFALGAADFTNAYLIDSRGRSQYGLNNERGTIVKVSPGGREREIFCTGTRFPVAMAFNEEGDLFATDQEGATWLPNGNPYDELLHLEEGRHYGFPPRHPSRLPDVIDEPSVYDYRPQHQSTCGLNFNVPVNGGRTFGPEWWRGDALVSGYSRGKIYRTTLVKTPAGYVARNAIFASLKALTVDANISPQGDLVVATHSGLPDWGYGPHAEGRLFKITYSDPDIPNPVSAWAAKPDEVRIAFDKPVPRGYLDELADRVAIEFGEYVEAADRYEVLRPGYKAVERQMRFPRERLQVKDVHLSADRRTVVINTFTHTSPVSYAVTLPAFSRDEEREDSFRQIPAIDLSYDLSGVAVTWQATSGDAEWSGWVPHLDLGVSRALMRPVAEHAELEGVLTKPGRITWRTKLNLWNMLRPDVQPESTLDYELPAEDVHLTLRSSEPLSINAGSASISKPVRKGELHETKVTFKEAHKRAYLLEVSMRTSGTSPVLELHYSTGEDPRPRALHTHRFFVPWLEDIYGPEISPGGEMTELAGGSWSRGRRLFFGESTCAVCHSVGRQGNTIGPDLSNLIYRDYKSVLKDIQDPSAAINPDYIAHEVTLDDDRTIVGTVSYKGDSVVVRDAAGKQTTVPRSGVRHIDPRSASLMPSGLDKMLGETKMKDLMTYLLTPLEPAKIELPFLPPMRNASEVTAVLKNSGVGASQARPSKLLRVLWVSGPKDHGPDEHDYPLQQERWTELLSSAANVRITPVEGWPEPGRLDAADVVVFYWNYPAFTKENGKQLDAFLQRGGGLVYLHYAVDATADPNTLAERIGMAWKGGASKFRHGRVELDFHQATHPIARGFRKTVFEDESYWELVKGNTDVNVLATGQEEGKQIPLMWTKEGPGEGRVFVSILGHYNWTFDDPLFRILLLRSIAWAGHQPEDRLVDLASLGARVSK